MWRVFHVLFPVLNHLGQALVIRNMPGWSLLEKTKLSGMIVPGCLPKEKIFFLFLTQKETGKRRDRFTQRERCPVIFHVLVRVWTWPRYWATHWKAVLVIATWSVEGHRTLGAILVCGRGNANGREPDPLPKTEIVCWLALRRRTFIWKVWGCQAHWFSEFW